MTELALKMTKKTEIVAALVVAVITLRPGNSPGKVP
jgi:hypothetical protein